MIDLALSKKISMLRKEQEINQTEIAKLLGTSRTAISQIENGERKVTAEELGKLAEFFCISVDNLLDKEKEPEVVIEETKRKKIQPDIRINVPQRNLEKFKEILLYILNKVGSKPNIGETVIYKLLYFMDFNFYERFEEQLIGATYIKNRYGPAPIEFRKIAEKMVKDKEIIKVRNDYFNFPQTKYLPLRRPDLSILKANEIEIIDDVLNHLSDMNASQISDYSHNDVPWLTTEDGQIMEYESVFYRTVPYSIRQYD